MYTCFNPSLIFISERRVAISVIVYVQGDPCGLSFYTANIDADRYDRYIYEQCYVRVKKKFPLAYTISYK